MPLKGKEFLVLVEPGISLKLWEVVINQKSIKLKFHIANEE